jgi:hypothetical protein
MMDFILAGGIEREDGLASDGSVDNELSGLEVGIRVILRIAGGDKTINNPRLWRGRVEVVVIVVVVVVVEDLC